MSEKKETTVKAEKKENAAKAVKALTLPQKLLEIQKRVDTIVKDGKNTSDRYDFASDENVLDTFRPLMDEYGLLLIPRIVHANLLEGTTKSGTVRYLTELHFEMLWHDVESGEQLVVPWYAQGVDLAGEKGVGKAATYAEKYFLLKFFHVSTKKDDPDAAGHTRSGELRQRGTQAARESDDFYRKAITAMMTELSGGDEAKFRAGLVAMTKSDKHKYSGAEDVRSISPTALPVTYAKLKKRYTERTGKDFVMEADD